MTKRDLENCTFWKNLPEDADIVFNTALKGEECCPMTMNNISVRYEVIGYANGEPILRKFVVISAPTPF